MVIFFAYIQKFNVTVTSEDFKETSSNFIYSIIRTMNKFIHLQYFEVAKFWFLAHPSARVSVQFDIPISIFFTETDFLMWWKWLQKTTENILTLILLIWRLNNKISLLINAVSSYPSQAICSYSSQFDVARFCLSFEINLKNRIALVPVDGLLPT